MIITRDFDSKISFEDIFSSIENMISRFDEYIDFCKTNPLKEEKMFGDKGETGTVNKMRIPTLQGFCYYLRCPFSALKQYKENWPDAYSFIEDAFYAISIEGAAAGLLKESLVIRKLGLAEKIEESHTIRKIVIMHTPDNGRAIQQPEEKKFFLD